MWSSWKENGGTITVERFRNALIGTSDDIQRCDPLDCLRLLVDNGQLTVFDVVAIRSYAAGLSLPCFPLTGSWKPPFCTGQN